MHGDYVNLYDQDFIMSEKMKLTICCFNRLETCQDTNFIDGY